MSHSYKETSELGKGFVLFLIIVLIGIFGLHACATSVAQSTTYTEVVTICGKEPVQTEHGHEYRVYTSGDTYVVEDYYGVGGVRTNSADVYGRIQVGKTYLVRSFGIRSSTFSVFRNIETVTDTTQKPTGTCG